MYFTTLIWKFLGLLCPHNSVCRFFLKERVADHNTVSHRITERRIIQSVHYIFYGRSLWHNERWGNRNIQMVVQSLKREGHVSNQMLQPQSGFKIAGETVEAATTESQHQFIELSSPEGAYDTMRETGKAAYGGTRRSSEEHPYDEVSYIERVHNSVHEVPLHLVTPTVRVQHKCCTYLMADLWDSRIFCYSPKAEQSAECANCSSHSPLAFLSPSFWCYYCIFTGALLPLVHQTAPSQISPICRVLLRAQ